MPAIRYSRFWWSKNPESEKDWGEWTVRLDGFASRPFLVKCTGTVAAVFRNHGVRAKPESIVSALVGGDPRLAREWLAFAEASTQLESDGWPQVVIATGTEACDWIIANLTPRHQVG